MEKMHHRFINPLTPGPFLPKTHFLDILEIFSLDMSQISSNLLEKALQYDSMPFFLLASRFTTFCSSMRGKFWMMKRPTSLGFWLFNFFFFAFPCSRFVIFLLQSLTIYWASFQFKKFREGIIELGNFYHGVATCSHRKFCSEVLSIFEHISGSIVPITLIWVSLKRSFPTAELEYR